MARTPLILSGFGLLLLSAPATGGTFQSGITDARIVIDDSLVVEDPQEDTFPGSSVTHNLGGFGLAGAYSQLFDGAPADHEIGALINYDTDFTGSVRARSFSLFSQNFEVSDTDPGRSGPALLGATFDLDWSSRYIGDPTGGAFIYVDFFAFDADRNVSGVLGGFSCGASFGSDPSCSGTANFDLSQVDIDLVTGGYDVTGNAYLEFSGGQLNSSLNFFGPAFSNELIIQNGRAGQYADLGQGNTLSWSLMSNESSVTVMPLVPEPGTAALLALGLLGLRVCAR